jgi:hypothetical protein
MRISAVAGMLQDSNIHPPNIKGVDDKKTNTGPFHHAIGMVSLSLSFFRW